MQETVLQSAGISCTVHKKAKRSEIIPATWGMRSQRWSRNTALAEKLVFGMLSRRKAWSDDQRAKERADKNDFIPAMKLHVLLTWNSHIASAWKNTPYSFCTDDLFVPFGGAISTPARAPGCNYFTQARRKTHLHIRCFRNMLSPFNH